MEVTKSFTEELIIPADKRMFEFGGEFFKWRYQYWEEFVDEVDKAIATAAALAKSNGEDNATTYRELVATYQKGIEPYLDTENEAIKRWRALCKRKENPVPAHAFQALYMWLTEVTAARPTEQPSPSGDGQPTTGTT